MSERLYKLPEILKGRCDEDKYRAWLKRMTDSHRRRFSRTLGVTMAIHQAVEAHNGNDPYTGRLLRWDLIGTYNNDESMKNSRECRTKSADKPTVDHNFDSSGKLRGFEIVSQQVNDCKSDLSSQEFIELCRLVTEYSDCKKRP